MEDGCDGVRGVLIVADGAAELTVRTELMRATMTALDVPASSVEVLQETRNKGRNEYVQMVQPFDRDTGGAGPSVCRSVWHTSFSGNTEPVVSIQKKAQLRRGGSAVRVSDRGLFKGLPRAAETARADENCAAGFHRAARERAGGFGEKGGRAEDRADALYRAGARNRKAAGCKGLLKMRRRLCRKERRPLWSKKS